MGIKASIAGQQDSLQHQGSLSTPAPMLGLYADWEVVPRLLRASHRPVARRHATPSVNFDLTDDRLDLEYYFFKNYGLGAGYHYVGFNGDEDLRQWRHS